MLVSDIISEASTANLASRLKNFNWNFEFLTDQKRHLKELEVLESKVYELWKNNPSLAISLWNENTPFHNDEKNIVPSFIFRRQAQDKN